ncbi:hypothetical protein [Mycobacterium marinum]|uniref:hypothetical protein n=3 Tax=Mycobacterium marinum TaxID=1781 RepID=UPI0021C2AC2D|nr:hypothetical protein [Mycobacterium marinum]
MTSLQVDVRLAQITTPHPPGPAHLEPRMVRSQRWPTVPFAIALGAVGLIALAAAVLGVLALVRPMPSATRASVALTPAVEPTHSAEQIENAKKNLCDVYQVASRAVQVDTNGGDKALARIALTNAAGMLDAAADDPALGSGDRDAARTLAGAYRAVVALGSVFDKTSSVGRASLDDANRADGVMAERCQ